MTILRSVLCAGVLALVAPGASLVGRAVQERGSQPVTAAELRAAIDKLGNLDFPIRMNAARTVRRAPAAQAVPALLQAVAEHADGYVRFRALVLLSGFNDPRGRDAMIQVVADPNDRLRAVAYSFFEHTPDARLVPMLLGVLDKETAEFVRPQLIRALAANGNDARVREVLLREANRGQDFFRSVVIEALGDYKATYAVDALITIAGLEGPLQQDAAIALGKVGDKRALATFIQLQHSAPREAQPSVAAAICLLGVNCSSHQNYLQETLRFTEHNGQYQSLLRGAASGLAAIAGTGNEEALDVLFQVGVPSEDPARAAIALAIGTVALRKTPLMLMTLEKLAAATGHTSDTGLTLASTVDLLREGFDMLEEDFEKERFFAAVRKGYWAAADGSPTRTVAALLIQKLEF